MKVAVVIPTFNGGDIFQKLLRTLDVQTCIPIKKLVIDSQSVDNTRELAKKYGCEVVKINREEFNHGGTRQFASELVPEADVLVFLTQDAILADEYALEKIIACFNKVTVGAAYGRQLPHKGAKPLEAHARLFNYPSQSRIKSMADAKLLGIKTAFISNSFAAYRKSALISVGGFPNDTILGEDTYVAAKMVLNNWEIAYCAEAAVYHSHNYDYISEFKRYFDIGVFHSRESWIRQKFGQAEGEGKKYILSEFAYLMNTGHWYLVFAAVLRNALKLLGYRLGLAESRIPRTIKALLSMHSHYWTN